LDELIAGIPIAIWPVSVEQLTWVRYALETYGRGRHPAKLNFGDCFTYALAKSTGEPLLFKGSDFSLTDLKSAV
jgi:ribonuclease VapC